MTTLPSSPYDEKRKRPAGRCNARFVPRSQNWPSPALVGRVCPFPRIPSGNVLPLPPLAADPSMEAFQVHGPLKPYYQVKQVLACRPPRPRRRGDGSPGWTDCSRAATSNDCSCANHAVGRGRKKKCMYICLQMHTGKPNHYLGGQDCIQLSSHPLPPSLSKVVLPPMPSVAVHTGGANPIAN